MLMSCKNEQRAATDMRTIVYLTLCASALANALPEPAGNAPIGVLIAVCQSGLSINPFNTCTQHTARLSQHQQHSYISITEHLPNVVLCY